MCEVFKENIIAKNKYIVNKHNIILKYTYIFCKQKYLIQKLVFDTVL